MASILTRKSRIAQPQDFVLVDDSLGDFHAAYVINNTLFNAKTGAFPAKNSNFTGGIGLAGSYLEPNANDKTLNPGIPAGDVYGVLYLFEVRQADITSASNAASIISVTENVNDASGVRIGSSTGYLTGETLAVVNSASTRRNGISETIPKGLHTLVVQWNGSKYEIWLDGHLPAQLAAAGGDTQLLNFAPYIGLRSLSSQPWIRTYLFATSNNKNIDFREYQENPWRLLKPLQARIWVPVSSGGGSGITGTLAATESGSDTASASGTVTVQGTLAATESGSDTAAFSGSAALPGITGTLAAAETGSDTAAATGAVTVQAALAATETGSDSAAFSGQAIVQGLLAGIESGSDTAFFNGSSIIISSGTLAASESGSDSAAVSGRVTVQGTMAAAETGADVAAFSGPSVATGTMAATEAGSDGFASAGTVLLLGELAAVEVGLDTAVFRQTYSPPSADTIFTIMSERRIFTVASEQRIFKD